MKPRNVIISLLFVVALLVFTLVKVRYWEPKKRLSFNRYPSKTEYSELALCQMDCFHVNANDITGIIKTGKVNSAKTNMKEKPFPVFAIEGFTKNKTSLGVMVIQSGKAAKIKSCYRPDATLICNCPGETKGAISYFKSKKRCNIF